MKPKKTILVGSIIGVCIIIGIAIFITHNTSPKSGYEIYFQQLKGDLVVYSGEEVPLNLPFGIKGNVEEFDKKCKALNNQANPVTINGVKVLDSDLQKAYGNNKEAYYLLTVSILKEKNNSKKITVDKIKFLDGVKHKIGNLNVIFAERENNPLDVKESTVLGYGFGIGEYQTTLKNTSGKDINITSFDCGSLNDISHKTTPLLKNRKVKPGERITISINFDTKKNFVGYYLTPKLTYLDSDGKVYESYTDPCQYGISIDEKEIQNILKTMK